MNNSLDTNNNQNNQPNIGNSNIGTNPGVATQPNLGAVNQPNLGAATQPNLGTFNPNNSGVDCIKKEVVNTNLSNEHVDLVKKNDGIKSFKVNPNVNVGFNIGKNLSDNKETKIEEEPEEEEPVDPAVLKAQKKKTIGVFVLFGIIFAVVFFLPQISLYFANRKDMINQEPEIVDGLLSCSYTTDNQANDETYSWDFTFKDNRVTRANLITKTFAKKDILTDLEAKCMKLQETTSQYEGIKVECSYDNKSFVKKEYLNLQTIVVDQAYTAYTEAGGVYPNFYGGENIQDIEKDMNAKGFKCKKSK